MGYEKDDGNGALGSLDNEPGMIRLQYAGVAWDPTGESMRRCPHGHLYVSSVCASARKQVRQSQICCRKYVELGGLQVLAGRTHGVMTNLAVLLAFPAMGQIELYWTANIAV